MILDFIIGLLLMGSLFHLSFGIWRIETLSPFGTSSKSNIWYGILVLGISLGLFLYQHGFTGLLENGMYLGGLFALLYTVIFGMWYTRQK